MTGTDRAGVARAGASTTTPKTLVYTLNADSATNRDPIAQAMVKSFVEAHGIDPNLFVVGTRITVFRHLDGTFWLHTWRALPGMPECVSCPACLRQEQVETPLRAPVPDIAGATFCHLPGDGPPTVAPEDAEAAAESAHQAALEEHAQVMEQASRLLQRRATELQRIRQAKAVTA